MIKPMAGRYGYSSMFGAERDADGLWLYGRWADPGSRWDPGVRVAFSLSQVINA